MSREGRVHGWAGEPAVITYHAVLFFKSCKSRKSCCKRVSESRPSLSLFPKIMKRFAVDAQDFNIFIYERTVVCALPRFHVCAMAYHRVFAVFFAHNRDQASPGDLKETKARAFAIVFAFALDLVFAFARVFAFVFGSGFPLVFHLVFPVALVIALCLCPCPLATFALCLYHDGQAAAKNMNAKRLDH